MCTTICNNLLLCFLLYTFSVLGHGLLIFNTIYVCVCVCVWVLVAPVVILSVCVWVLVAPVVILSHVTTLSNFLLGLYFENTKFHANWMPITFQSRNPYFIHNFKYKKLKFKHLINNIVIDLRSS